MNTILKKILMLSVLCLTIAGCSYKSKVLSRYTKLNIDITEINGNYIYVRITPESDNVMYYFSVKEADEVNADIVSLTEGGFQRKMITEAENGYQTWKKYFEGNMDNYAANFCDHVMYVTPNEGYVLDLKPNTRYYAFGFCINPESHAPVGPVQKVDFWTTDIKPSADQIDFNFMINDDKGQMYYYVRPSRYGRICMDTYFSAVIKDSDYMAEPYSGDIRHYLNDWIEQIGSGVTYFLNIDISRYEPVIYLEEDEQYTIVAMPYGNPLANQITTLGFTYKKGMKTDYSHDFVID